MGFLLFLLMTVSSSRLVCSRWASSPLFCRATQKQVRNGSLVGHLLLFYLRNVARMEWLTSQTIDVVALLWYGIALYTQSQQLTSSKGCNVRSDETDVAREFPNSPWRIQTKAVKFPTLSMCVFKIRRSKLTTHVPLGSAIHGRIGEGLNLRSISRVQWLLGASCMAVPVEIVEFPMDAKTPVQRCTSACVRASRLLPRQ